MIAHAWQILVVALAGEPVALWRGTGVSPVKTGQNAPFSWRLAHGQDAHATLWGHNATGSWQDG